MSVPAFNSLAALMAFTYTIDELVTPTNAAAALVDEDQTEALRARCASDEHFLSVLTDCRRAFDRALLGKTNPDFLVGWTDTDRLRAATYKGVLMIGLDSADSSALFQKKSKSTGGSSAEETLPKWFSYLNSMALGKAFPHYCAELDRLLAPENRAETEKACLNLPAVVKDHLTFFRDGATYTSLISDFPGNLEWEVKTSDGKTKKHRPALGYRNDAYKPVKQVDPAAAANAAANSEKKEAVEAAASGSAPDLTIPDEANPAK